MSQYASAGLHCNEVRFSSASWYPSLLHPQGAIDCRWHSAHKALVETPPWFLTSTTQVCETKMRRVEKIQGTQIRQSHVSSHTIHKWTLTASWPYFSHYREFQKLQNLESRRKLILVANQPPVSVLRLQTSCKATASATLHDHSYGKMNPTFTIRSKNPIKGAHNRLSNAYNKFTNPYPMQNKSLTQFQHKWKETRQWRELRKN